MSCWGRSVRCCEEGGVGSVGLSEKSECPPAAPVGGRVSSGVGSWAQSSLRAHCLGSCKPDAWGRRPRTLRVLAAGLALSWSVWSP